MGTCSGNNGICSRRVYNQEALYGTNQILDFGKDIDDAVLAATNNSIQQSQTLITILHLTFACENLPNLDTFSKSDAMCVLYQIKGTVMTEVGRTETIMDNLNPKFIKALTVEYHFEERQKFKLRIFDVDNFNETAPLDKHDFIGEVEFMIHEVVTSPAQTLIRPIMNEKKKEKNNGTLMITGEERSGKNKDMVQLELQVLLPDVSGKLFFIISRKNSPDQFVPIYKSEIQEHIDNHKHVFNFNMIHMLTAALCKEEDTRDIRLDFYSYVHNGKHKFQGVMIMTLKQLKNSEKQLSINKQETKIGAVIVRSFKVLRRHTFLEYVFGGCEISLTVAVDFTLSNGNPKDQESLHYFDLQRNEYLQAIQSVGNILQFYDSDKKIPMFGFGAKLPNAKEQTLHCFAVNGDIFNPECYGLDNLIEVYQNAIKKLHFYGPTHFHEVIKMVVDMASYEEVNQNNQKYFILLLITDGAINDTKETIDEIVRASELPISIIIVGVGKEDFKFMDFLDSDENQLFSETHNKSAERDIVQFVPYRDCNENQMILGKKILEEVPSQVISYFHYNKITPKPYNEEQKRMILKKLSKKLVDRENVGRMSGFFRKLQDEFIQKCVRSGLKEDEVRRFLIEKAIPENSVDMMMDLISNTKYKNGLRKMNKKKTSGGQQQQKQQERHHKHLNEEHKIQSSNDLPRPNQRMNPNYIEYTNGIIDQQKKRISMPQNFQQNSLFKDLCKICLKNKYDTVLVPCGHRCICHHCSVVIKSFKCPVCNEGINEIIRSYDT